MPPQEPLRNMQLISDLNAVTYAPPSAVAIGNFDGLHLGHRAVIETMRTAAQAGGWVPSVLTFEPHPRRFFAPQTPRFRLATPQDKLHGLQALGVQCVFMPPFDAAFAALSAEDFLEQVLRQQLNARAVITGENFAFGSKRGGDVAMLRAWGKKHDIAIHTVLPVWVGDAICSSSAIRAALEAGNIAGATQLLGAPYRLTGAVVHGDGRGKTIGFPTANVAVPEGLKLPMHGVYAVRVQVGDAHYKGVANVGVRPTVGVQANPTVEVHVFDFVQEIYDRKMQVEFIAYLRGEQKFDGIAALTAQIAKDCIAAQERLHSAA